MAGFASVNSDVHSLFCETDHLHPHHKITSTPSTSQCDHHHHESDSDESKESGDHLCLAVIMMSGGADSFWIDPIEVVDANHWQLAQRSQYSLLYSSAVWLASSGRAPPRFS